MISLLHVYMQRPLNLLTLFLLSIQFHVIYVNVLENVTQVCNVLPHVYTWAGKQK